MKSYPILAWASCVVANLPTQKGACAVLARSNVGIYTFTLSSIIPMNAGSWFLHIGPAHCASSASWDVVDTSDTVKTISFFDAAGAAIEMISFTLTAGLLLN
jgi:hypothetical protein